MKVSPDEWNEIYNSLLDSAVDMYDGDPADVNADSMYDDILRVVENTWNGKEDLESCIRRNIDPSDYLPESVNGLRKTLKEDKEEWTVKSLIEELSKYPEDWPVKGYAFHESLMGGCDGYGWLTTVKQGQYGADYVAMHFWS